MLLNLSERSSERLKCILHNIYSVLRMFVGAYCLAKAVGLMIVPGRMTMMHGLFTDSTALTICATFFGVTGALLLLGFAVRPIAVLLGFHVLTTAILGIMSGMDHISVELAQSAGLLVAVALVGIGHPFKAPKLMEVLRIHRAMQRPLPQMPDLEHMRQHSPDVELDLTAKCPAIVSKDERDEWGDDDAGNLFDELWERKPRSKSTQVA